MYIKSDQIFSFRLKVTDAVRTISDTLRINYLDNDVINIKQIPKQKDIEELKDLDINSLYYISNGPVLSNFKVFKSISDYENRVSVENPAMPSKIKENLDFWKDLSNFHIIKMIDEN